ncbi:hypothetical protein [Aliikangiella sp. IMCC44632]
MDIAWLVKFITIVTGISVTLVTILRFCFDKKKYKMELQEKYFDKAYKLYLKHLECGQLSLSEPLSSEKLVELRRLHQEASFLIPKELEDYSYQLISWFMSQRVHQQIITSRQKAGQDPRDHPEALNAVLKNIGLHLIATAEDGDMIITSEFKKYLKPVFPIFNK